MKPGRNDPCSCGSGLKFKKCCEGKFQTIHGGQTISMKAYAPSQDELKQLIGLFNAGRYGELEQRTRLMVEQYPNSGFVWKLLGAALVSQGKDTLSVLQRVTKLLPDDADAHYNLGNYLVEHDQLEDAVASYRRALDIKPDYSQVHANLGFVLHETGQIDSAMESYHRALALKPDFAEVHNNLGNVLKDLGRLNDAVTSCRRALQIKPDFAEAHHSLGNVLRELGQINGAVSSYRSALEIKPGYVQAHYSLGNCLKDLGQIDDAVSCYHRALQIKPDYAEAHNNLGLALKGLGKFEAAAESYRRALHIKPDLAEAHSNLGNVLSELGQLDQAMVSLRQALEIKPDLVEACTNLGNVLSNLGLTDEAVACYCRLLKLKPDYSEIHSNLLFTLNHSTSHHLVYQIEEARRYGNIAAAKVGTRFSAWQCISRPERLRVGLLSGDLYNHVVGYFLEGVLAHIDPARIELIAYPTGNIEDELTARIRPCFSKWHSLSGISDEAAAQLIHADGVHVLLDISGHTARNRLPVFSWKPAPVQASWLGYFATTGVAEMDYVLVDAVGVPEAQQAQFTEAAWYLPDTRLCFTPPNVEIPVAALPALSKGYITFGCFQSLPKVDDEVLSAWGEIFAAVPNARLRIQCKQLGEPAQAERMLQRLQHYGIAAARVGTHGAVSREDYLASHAVVDMILDTFPFPGGTTTCEALWMGVPTLTLAGDRLLARQGASLLTAAGLPDWVAESRANYISKAIELAGDLPKLSALREILRHQVLASPIFDGKRFARNLEEALWGMWNNYGDRQKVWSSLNVTMNISNKGSRNGQN